MLWLGFLVNDRVKLLAYRIFDPTKPPLLAKKTLAKTTVISHRSIAARAYEIYEERGRHDGQADQDWMEAETEIRKGTQAHAKAGSR